MRVVAADAFIGGEPDNFFGIDEDPEDMIRTERAAGAFESEMLRCFSILKMKGAAAIGADPNIFVRAARDRHNRTRRRVGPGRLERFALVKQTAIFGARFDAGPQTSAAVGFQRVNEITARFADNFPGLAVLDQENSVALRAGVQLLAGHRETGDLQRTGMILVGALNRLIRNRSNCKGGGWISLGFGHSQR